MSDESAPDLETGFTTVDAQPDTSMLVEGMERTAQWPAVVQLRSWEREHLAMAANERLLDVGCGMGDMACGYAAGGATVTGVDASAAMLDAARGRAQRESVSVDFHVGDATALDFPDNAFDACRSERVLQWVPDIGAAVRDIVRVVRPGGRLCLIDTDWRTFAADLDDLELSQGLGRVFMSRRGPSAAAGGRLLNLCRDAGVVELDCTAATHVWTEWDPEIEPNPSGLFPLRAVAPQLVGPGLMTAEDADRLIDGIFAAGRAGRLFMSLSMVAVYGRVSG